MPSQKCISEFCQNDSRIIKVDLGVAFVLLLDLFLVAPKSVKITGVREAKTGETLTLTCTTSNSNPAAVITWIPRGTSLIQDKSHTEVSPDGGYITISQINVTLTHQQNNAMYTCEALNADLGVRVSDTAIVGVLCKLIMTFITQLLGP